MGSKTFTGKDKHDLDQQIWNWRSANPTISVVKTHPIENLQIKAISPVPRSPKGQSPRHGFNHNRLHYFKLGHYPKSDQIAAVPRMSAKCHERLSPNRIYRSPRIEAGVRPSRRPHPIPARSVRPRSALLAPGSCGSFDAGLPLPLVQGRDRSCQSP
jgi:hypothetical protein